MKFSKSILKEVPSKAAKINRQKAIGFLWGYEVQLSPSAANIVTDIEEIDLITEQSIHEIQEMLDGELISADILYEHLEKTYQRGVIPMILAVALQPVRRRLVIYHGQSALPFTPELWEAMDTSPKEYAVELICVSEEQQRYITALESLFKDFIVEQEKSINSFTYLQNSMQRFIINQPKYVQATDNLTPTAIKLRNAWMNFGYAPHYLILDLLPSILGEQSIDLLAETLEEIQNVIPNLYSEIHRKIEEIFTDGIISWSHSLPQNIRYRLFDNREELVLAKILQANELTDSLLSDMAILLTGLSPENFTQETTGDFFRRIKELKAVTELHPQNGNQYLICLEMEKEPLAVGAFCGMPYLDDYGKMFFREVSTLMEEYSRSVPLPERRQVLIDVLIGREQNALL